MYNRIILIGRLAADPELRTTPNGTSVAQARIAVNRPFAKDKSDFFTVVCWRQSAEFLCRYFSKGRALGVEGSLQSREYTDREGVRRTAFEVQADRLFFTGEKAREGADGQGFAQAGPPQGFSQGEFSAVDSDEDLPF